MANTIHVDVVSAEEQIFSGEAEFVVLPASWASSASIPRHAPLLTPIKPGAVRIKVPGQANEELVFVQGGFPGSAADAGDGARRHGDSREGLRRSVGDGSAKGRARDDAEQDVEGRDRDGGGRARGGASAQHRSAIRKMRHRA